MGSIQQRPDGFVGTSINLDNGDVTNPFTGSVNIVSTAFEVAAVPEPSTLILLGLGTLGLFGYGGRRRRRN